jgi:hypothetical protein
MDRRFGDLVLLRPGPEGIRSVGDRRWRNAAINQCQGWMRALRNVWSEVRGESIKLCCV